MRKIIMSCNINKRIWLFAALLLQLVNVSSQTSEFIGTMTTEDVHRDNIKVKVIEKGEYVSGTIYSMRVSKHLDITVDVDIDSLTLTKNENKKIIPGKNIVPHVNGKKIEKIKVNDFYGIIENNKLNFKTSFGKKKMQYSGIKHTVSGT